MHNGAFATLEAVVEHYSNPRKSIRDYVLPAAFGAYRTELSLRYDEAATVDVAARMDSRVAEGLFISKEDKRNLVAFLKYGLTESR